MNISRLLGSAIGLSVATVGAGVLAIPACFEAAGVGSVVAVLVVVAFFTVTSIDFLALCAEKLDLNSYEEISDELLGVSLKQLIRWILILYNAGTAVGYIVVVIQILVLLLPLTSKIAPSLALPPLHAMVIIWATVMLPLSCLRSMSSLRSVSFAAMLTTFFIAGIVVFRYFVPSSPGQKEYGSLHGFVMSRNALTVLPVLLFSYDCQSLAFQMRASLTQPSRANVATVSILSVCITGVVYGVVGFFGYATNTPTVHENILANYNPVSDHLFALGEACYAFTVILAYVLVLLPCRDAIFQLWYGHGTNLTNRSVSSSTVITTSVLLSAACLALALLAPGFLYIVAVMGGLCSSTLCFIYPALFRQRLHATGIAPYKSSAERGIVYAMLGFGGLGVVLGIHTALF